MKLKAVIIMLLCAAFMQAQDLSTGLSVVNDLGNYPMQPIAKPGYLQTITDPSFGTTIRRISNAPQGIAHGCVSSGSRTPATRWLYL